MIRLFVFGLGMLAFVANANAQDDVYVDMSVLNSLGNGHAVAPNQPLFPIVAKEARKPRAVKPKPTTTTVVVNKVEDKPVVVIEPKEPEKINIPDKVVVEPVVVEPAKVDEIADIDITEQDNAATKDDADTLPEENTVGSDDDLVVDTNDNVEITVIQGEDDVETPISPREAELLTPTDEVAAAQIIDNKIYFADGDITVNDVKKSLIDAIVAKFADPINNKISIMSYNYDNGEDSFRKKRISLNRAVEIRSYLLSKGYKNFSIKVINVTDDETKKDLVEITEL